MRHYWGALWALCLIDQTWDPRHPHYCVLKSADQLVVHHIKTNCYQSDVDRNHVAVLLLVKARSRLCRLAGADSAATTLCTVG
jgi:hypothetical protein